MFSTHFSISLLEFYCIEYEFHRCLLFSSSIYPPIIYVIGLLQPTKWMCIYCPNGIYTKNETIFRFSTNSFFGCSWCAKRYMYIYIFPFDLRTHSQHPVFFLINIATTVTTTISGSGDGGGGDGDGDGDGGSGGQRWWWWCFSVCFWFLLFLPYHFCA